MHLSGIFSLFHYLLQEEDQSVELPSPPKPREERNIYKPQHNKHIKTEHLLLYPQHNNVNVQWS